MAQINATVGDFAGNSAKILSQIETAAAARVQLLVFPELALCGYPPEDLLHAPAFIDDCARALRLVAAEVGEMVVIVGTVVGQADLYNAAAVIQHGRVRHIYRKIHLPNYGVFDERRYFQPGAHVPVYTLNDIPFAVTVCEDLWQPAGPWADATLGGRARLLVNLSASPYHLGKRARREELFAVRAYENRVPVAFVNLVGGQDELVFDGGSAFFGADGRVLARAASFAEELLVVDLDDQQTLGAQHRARPGQVARAGALTLEAATLDSGAAADPLPPLPAPSVTEPLAPLEELYQALVLGVRDYVAKNGFGGVLIGLSGGIDSALTAAIAVEALGRAQVTGVTMPSRHNSAATRDDARLLADNLEIEFFSLPIEPVTDAFEQALSPLFGAAPRDVTEENLQARARGTLLMALSNKRHRLVLAAGNKSESAVGYCTLYGDMVGGFAPLKDVYKTTVFELARHVNERAGRALIPTSTIERPPSAELREDQRDEDALCPYPVLDAILTDYLEEDRRPSAIAKAHGIDSALVGRIVGLVEQNEYKRRQGAIGPKVTPRAFGKERRFPMTHRWTNDRVPEND